MTLFDMSGRKLSHRINAYFDHKIQSGEPVTVSGLACALGVSRADLLSLPKAESGADMIKSALRRIEAYSEEQLFSGKGATGIIFSLKANFGWRELESSPRPEPDLSGFSLEELRRIGGLIEV